MRTEFDRELAEFYAERARQIIFHGEILPSRISEHKDFGNVDGVGFKTYAMTCFCLREIAERVSILSLFKMGLGSASVLMCHWTERRKSLAVWINALNLLLWMGQCCVLMIKNMIFYTLKNGETWADAGENKPTVA